MDQWEYFMIDNVTPLKDRILNDLGRNGWELAGFSALQQIPNSGHPREFHYVFKRKVAPGV